MKNIYRFAILTGDLSAHLEHSDRRNKGCPKRILTNQANCGILSLVSAIKLIRSRLINALELKMFGLVITALGLGAGLAMDAFSVSLANGLHEPKMKAPRMLLIAGTFAIFQGVMPMLGWICVHTVLQYFNILAKFIPWIACGLLGYIGGKMIYDGVKCDCDECECGERLTLGLLMVQGIATSIDALSVGFAIAKNTLAEALLSAVIISVMTLAICIAGLILGKLFGSKFAGKASVFGGIILVAIGLEILISSFF